MMHNAQLAVLLTIAGIVESLTWPSCADSCRSVYTGDSTSTACNLFDYECICTNKVFLDSAICCLYESCSDSDRKEAEEYSHTVCEEEGYTIPTGLSCSSASASASADASSSSSGSEASKTSDSDSTSSATGYYYGTTDYATSGSDSDNSSDSYHSHKTHKTHTLKTGLGVGLGVGVPLISAIAGYIALLRRRRKNAPQNAAPPVTQVPPEGYQAPPQGYAPPGYPVQNTAPPGYPPQGYPPQTYPPHGPSPPVAVAGGFVDAQKVPTPTVSPVSNPNSTPNPQEMMGNVPPPTHELSPESRPHTELPLNNPPTHSELPLSHPHVELANNHPPTHTELP